MTLWFCRTIVNRFWKFLTHKNFSFSLSFFLSLFIFFSVCLFFSLPLPLLIIFFQYIFQCFIHDCWKGPKLSKNIYLLKDIKILFLFVTVSAVSLYTEHWKAYSKSFLINSATQTYWCSTHSFLWNVNTVLVKRIFCYWYKNILRLLLIIITKFLIRCAKIIFFNVRLKMLHKFKITFF